MTYLRSEGKFTTRLFKFFKLRTFLERLLSKAPSLKVIYVRVLAKVKIAIPGTKLWFNKMMHYIFDVETDKIKLLKMMRELSNKSDIKCEWHIFNDIFHVTENDVSSSIPLHSQSCILIASIIPSGFVKLLSNALVFKLAEIKVQYCKVSSLINTLREFLPKVANLPRGN